MHGQRANKVVSDSPGQGDFIIGLVNSVLNFPAWQVRFSRNSNHKRTVFNPAYHRDS